jgi:hypothetical protein
MKYASHTPTFNSGWEAEILSWLLEQAKSESR